MEGDNNFRHGRNDVDRDAGGMRRHAGKEVRDTLKSLF
jgi:hypothetical protein